MATNGTPLGNMVIQLSMDGSQFSNTLEGIKREIKVAQSAMKANLAILSDAGDEYKALEAKISGLTRVMDANRRKIEELRRQHASAIETYGEGSKEVAKLATQINSAIARQSAWESQLKQTQAKLESLRSGTVGLRKEIDETRKANEAEVSSLRAKGSVYSAQQARIQGLSRVLDQYNQLIDRQKQKISSLTSTLGANDARVKAAENEYRKFVSEQKQVENELEQLKRKFQSIPSSFGNLSNKFGEFSAKMNSISEKAKSTGDKIKNIGSSITSSIGTATVGIGLGLGAATKKAMDFEAQMSSVKSVMSPDDAKKYGKELEKLAIIMGARTKYSATEAAMAIEELVKAGVSVTDIIHGGLEGALGLATAGELDLKDAAEIASTALNAFRKDNLSVARAADILAGAANASATDVQELKFGLSAVSAVASGVGLSFEDTATALAVFAQNGLKGQDAGTSLKTMLLNLSPSTKSAADMMDSLGLATKNTAAAYNWLVDRGIKPASHSSKDISDALMKLAKIQAGAGASASKVKKEYQELAKNSGFASSAFYDQNGKLKSLSEIAGLLHDRLKNLTEEQRQYALKVMFGTDAIRAANILYKEGAKGIQDMDAAMNKIKASDVAKQKLDNLKGTVEQLRGSLETAGISIGTALLPALRVLTEVVQKVVDGFNSLPSPLQHFIAISAAVTVAIGAIVSGFGFLAIGIGGFINSFGSIADVIGKISRTIAESGGVLRILSSVFTLITGPIGIAITVITALGTAFIVAYKKSETFRNFINRIGSAIQRAIGAIKTFAAGIANLFKGNTADGKQLLLKLLPPSVVSTIIGSVNRIKSAFYSMTQPIRTAYNSIKTVVNGIKALFNGNNSQGKSLLSKVLSPGEVQSVVTMVNKVKQVFNSTVSYLKNKFNELKAFWQQNGPMIKQAFVNIFNGIVVTVRTVMTVIMAVVKPILIALVAIFKVLLPPISLVFKGVFYAALFIIKSVLNNIKGVITGVLNVIMGIAKIFGGLFTGHWKQVWQGIKQVFLGAFQVIWNWMQLMWIGRMLKGALSFAMLFKAAFKNMWDIIKAIFSAPIKWLIGLVKNGFSVMRSVASSIMGALKNSLSGIWNSLKNIFVSVFKAIVDFGKNRFGALFKDTVSIFKSLWSFVKSIWNAIKELIINPIKTAFSAVKGLFSNIKTIAENIFNKMKDSLFKIFDNIHNRFKDLPTKMAEALKNGAKALGKAALIVSKILLDGLAKGVNGVIDGINWVLDKVGAHKWRLKKWNIPQYAKGTDNHPGGLAVVSDGIGKNKQELIVLPNGHAFLSPKQETMMYLPEGTSVLNGDATAKLLNSVPRYAKGKGWLQSAWDTVKDVTSETVSKVKDIAINVYDYITDPQKLLEKVISKTANLSGVLEPTLSLTEGAIKLLIKRAKDWIEDKIIGDIQPSGNPTEDVKRWVLAGMKIAGVSGSNWFNGLVTIAMHESGGNPKAINLWDSNARAGHPSAGLMQMIEPTFRRYAKKGYTDWMNPIHQVIADIFYIKDRYGSIANVPGIRSLSHGGKYVGYANGGIVTNEQIARIAEGNKPEAIIPLDPLKRTRALQILARTQQALGIPNGSTVQINNDNSDLIARQDQLIELLQQQNAILLKLLAKDQGIQQLQLDIPFNIDGRQIARATAKYTKDELDRLNKFDSRYGGVMTI
jgi:SLT domain-containing protein/phage-related protein